MDEKLENSINNSGIAKFSSFESGTPTFEVLWHILRKLDSISLKGRCTRIFHRACNIIVTVLCPTEKTKVRIVGMAERKCMCVFFFYVVIPVHKVLGEIQGVVTSILRCVRCVRRKKYQSYTDRPLWVDSGEHMFRTWSKPWVNLILEASWYFSLNRCQIVGIWEKIRQSTRVCHQKGTKSEDTS